MRPKSDPLGSPARSGNAAKSFIFGKAKLVDAIRVEARAGANAMDSTRFDFAQMREQLGE
jgi:hypothetical protein